MKPGPRSAKPGPAARKDSSTPASGQAARPHAGAPQTLRLGALGGVLGFHLARASVTTLALFEQHVGTPLDLRKTEYSLLLLLLANGALVPKRLAAALALSAPNLTMLLDRLQQRGLLQRERSATDGRSQNIVLTAAGHALAEQGAALATQMEAELRSRLSVAEHAMLLELLGKVARR